MSDDNESQYELVFEGPGDGSPDTLRKLKGAMVADLEMSVAEVQHILESYPLTIKRSESSHDLTIACQLLKNAGGAAYIVQPKSVSVPVSESTEEFQLEIDLDEVQKASEPKEKVFELDMNPDEDNSLAKIISEFQEDFGFNSEVPNKSSEDLTILPEPETFSATTGAPPHEAIHAATSEPANEVSPEISPPKSEEPDELLLQSEFIQSAPSPLPPPVESFSSGGWTLELDDQQAKKSDSIGATPKPASTAEPAAPANVNTLNLELDSESTPPALQTAATTTSEKSSAAKAPPALSNDELSLDAEAQNAPEAAPEVKSLKFKSQPPISKLFKNESPAMIVHDEEQKAREPHSKQDGHDKKNPQDANVNGASEGTQPTQSPSSKSSKRRRKRPKIPWDVVAPILFGMAALWFGNQYYFGSEEDALSTKAVSQLVQKMESEAGAREPEDADAPVIVDEYNIQAAKSNSTATVKWRFARTEDKKIKGTFELTTPASRELNKEEIANGVKRTPWLKKVDLGIINTALDAEGRFEVKTPIKAYVEDNSKILRVSGTATLKGRLAEDNQLTVEVTILSGIEVPPVGGKFFIERLASEKYRFYLSTGY